MRRTSTVVLALFLMGALFSSPALGQDGLDGLNEQLQNIGEEYVDGYVQPISDAFGANLNAGLFRTADVGNGFLPMLPFDVYLGVSTSGALIGSADKSFVAPRETFETTIERNGQQVTQRTEIQVVDPTQGVTDVEVPNAFGDTDPRGQLVVMSTILETGDTQVRQYDVPPGLIDTPVAPLIVPQLGVGSIAGTDVQFRYLPQSSISYGGSSFGEVGLTGVAVRHDLDQWVPAPLPFNVAAQGAWNQFTLKSQGNEILDASGWAVNVHASKGIPVLPVLVYGGLQYEKFNVTYDYTFTSPLGTEIPLSVEQDASNTVRGLAGVSLSLALVRFNVDYAVANGNNVVTAGFGVRL